MHVTSAEHWAPAPGTVLTWRASPVPGSASVPVPLSLNQRNHLEAAGAGEPSVWLAAAFEVPGAIDAVALGGAIADLVARHGTLQCEASLGQGGLVGRRHEPAALRWRSRVQARTTGPEETRALVHGCFDRGCDPFGYPAFVPAAISRPEGSTVLLALDHLHADAHSLPVVIEDLHALYDARRSGTPATLPEAGCFVAWAGEGAPPPVAGDDPRLRAWHDFLAARSYTLPVFPLALGVAPGHRVPQETVLRTLADAEETEALTRLGRGQGASTFAVLLTALGRALGRMGCAAPLQLLVPVGLRRGEDEWRAVGWFTTSVPLEVPTDGGAGSLAVTGERLRRARQLAQVPLDQVIASLPRPLVRTRGDVFMVSWLDYRHTPGHERARTRAAQHISAPTLADDLQLWLSRTGDGVALRVRLPGTAAARRAVGGLYDGWRAELSTLIAARPAAAS